MNMQSTIRRVRGAFLAHGLARGARVAEQLILVPLLLAGWGVERFGEWITLSSLSALAAVTSFGIGHAASSDIILRHGEGDEIGAGRSFATAFALLVTTTLAGLGLLWCATHFLDLSRFAPSDGIGMAAAQDILLLLGLSILMSFWLEPLIGVLSASVGAGLPNLVTALVKGVEIAVIAIALGLGATPTGIAAILLGSVVLNLAINTALAVRFAPWLTFRLSAFDPSAIRRTWRASLGFYFVFLSFNIVGVHAPRLIVSHELGAAAVTLFTVIVTYTRTARSLAGMVIQSVQAEIGRMAASRQMASLHSLIASALGSALGAAILLLVAANIAAPWLIPLWTHGQVPLQWDLLLALSVVALFGTFFDTLLNASAALHRLTLVAAGYTGGLALGLLLGWLLLPYLGLIAIAGVTMLLPEVIGTLAGLRTMRAILGKPGLRLRSLSLRPWRFLVLSGAKPEPLE